MKKIGIITHFYNSENYGGNLQAYALVVSLRKNAYDAEQISYKFRVEDQFVSRKDRIFKQIKQKDFLKRILKKAKKIPELLYTNYENRRNSARNKRKNAFHMFNQNLIAHSGNVFDSKNIIECITQYDAFITGSDQVWNFTWYNPEFFLDFVPSDKIKLSYAASIACDHLTNSQKEIFRNSLKDYKAVSVREKSAVNLISDLSPVPVENVLDPTLLLDRSDWDEICSDRVIADDYVFCYFLGENKQSRKLAERFAKQNNLKLVTIPHAGGWIKLADRNFGDVKLFDATPNDFISLIKHARYVFTDSFHAVVFSYIYQKQYFVFNRNKTGEMSSRIQDITELFGAPSRFCYDASRENFQYLNSLSDIDYTQANPIFEKLKQESIEFLKRNLGDTEG